MDAAVMRTSSSAVLVEHHFAALVTGDAALAARCIHPSHVNHMAANEPPACAAPGVPGFVATSAWLRLAFGDLSFEIIELTADADRTMAHVRMSGRQTGPFVVFPPGVRPVVFAPTGLAFGVRQVHVFRHRDERHGEHIAVRDDLGMMTQLGHLPPSPRAAWRMGRSALTGYRARAVRDAIRVSAEAAAAGDAGADAAEWHPRYTAWCGLTGLPGGPASQQAERQSLTGG